MSERKKLKIISSTEIMNTPMKKQRFIVDGIIYPGVHILSGDPKIVKSWMVLDMCLAVAKGEKFLGRETEQGQVVYMALEDTFVSLQSRLYELTDEPSENLNFTLIANLIVSGLEDDLRECKKIFPNLKMVVIDTLQKIRNTFDAKYGADYHELSVLKGLADSLEIAVILVYHNSKAHDSNPNNLILGTNGIAGCADGLLVLTRNGENAKLHISGRGASALELNLKREKSKWILLDDIPPSEPDIFSFIIHDFLYRKKSVSGTASEICSELKKSIPNRILSVIGYIVICFSTMMKFVPLGLITAKPRATASAVFLSATTLTGTAAAEKLCIRKILSLSTLKSVQMLMNP